MTCLAFGVTTVALTAVWVIVARNRSFQSLATAMYFPAVLSLVFTDDITHYLARVVGIGQVSLDNASPCRCHYTKSNPIDDHSNISSKKLQKQNFKPLGHYTCMQCGTSHLQAVLLSHIILATYRKFTVATVRFTQNVSCNIYTHPRYEQVANVHINNSSDNKSY